jgi:hypothetical protein
MLDNNMKGAKSFNRCMDSAVKNGEVGVHLHILTSQPPTSRIGFVGKRPTKKTLKLLAEKLLQQAQKNPSLIKAAVNLAQYAR